MAFYEIVLVARSDLSKPDVTKLVQEFTAVIEREKGRVVREEYWGLRSLAYKIKKNAKGHYTLLCVEAPGSAVAEFTRTLGINEDIIRHLIVQVDEIGKKPSAMMQSHDDNANEDEAA